MNTLEEDRRKDEIYFSVDIETTGPIPGVYSMLSIGVAAFLKDGTLVDTFERNIKEAEGAERDPDVMKWWEGQQKAWEACHVDPVDAESAMKDLDYWVRSTARDCNGCPVFVAYPASFDFNFVFWYLVKYVGKSVFSFAALDIKTYAMAMLGGGFKESYKKKYPKRWFSKRRHTHVAIDDALGQGELFINMLKEQEETINKVNGRAA